MPGPLTRALAGLALVAFAVQARADPPKIDPKEFPEQLKVAAKHFRESKKETLADAKIDADITALTEMVKSDAFRAFLANLEPTNAPTTDVETGQVIVSAWEEFRRRKGQGFDSDRAITFTDIAGEIGDLVRVRFESVPAKAVFKIDKRDAGPAPVVRFLSKKSSYRIDAAADGHKDYLDEKYTPPAGGELHKVTLEKK